MKFVTTITLLISTLSVGAQDCPAGTLVVGGSSTVDPLAELWIAEYGSICTSTTLNLQEEGGSSAGARGVCNTLQGDDVLLDIGDMSREWKDSEATTSNGYLYNCVDTARSAIQLDVAIDGLTVAVATGGSAASCITELGGLTIDQLRYIYTDLTRANLIASGWDASAIKTTREDDFTKRWSDFVASPTDACPDVEILVSGADVDSGTYEYFTEQIFTADNEDHPFGNGYVNSEVDSVLVDYLTMNPNAISYFGYAYAVEFRDVLTLVPIKNPTSGQYVLPTETTINSGDYAPFSRRIYMNVLNNPGVLNNARPFFEFAFSQKGSDLVAETGYVAIPQWERVIMLTRLTAEGGVDLNDVDCGGASGAFDIAGSSTVYPVARLWAEVFQMKCGGSVDISYEGGGSGRGASRVCGVNSEGLSAVDIGDMSRQWKETEATTTNGYEYDCVGSNRNAIQIEVAIDGLTIAVKRDSPAEACIEALGGLTVDQLRWMFTNLGDSALEAAGWDPRSVANLDGDPSTHRWSELKDDPACLDAEIMISGGLGGTTDYFTEVVLNDGDGGESFDTSRHVADHRDEVLVQYLMDNDSAISFFGYAYYIQNDREIVAAPIQNSEGRYVLPSAVSVQDGSYNPFARKIYMNLLDDPASLAVTRPFMEFGLSSVGEELVGYTGYSAIPELERIIMRERAGTSSAIKVNPTDCGPSGDGITIAGSSTVFPVAELWGGIYEVNCGVRVEVNGGGSSIGADRVCGGGDGEVDIGNMSREWKDSEASESSENLYKCLEHDTSRSAFQIDVAIDGLTVATSITGVAHDCIIKLDGLTLDQLRWIYSSYTDDELINTGWDATSLANSDNDSATHKWSELNAECANTEILIAGADDLSGTYEYFLEAVLSDHDNGETFDGTRPSGYVNSALDEDLVSYIQEFEAAISYFGYAYYFQNQEVLDAVAIENSEGRFIVPNESTVGSGTYNPLARRIYMNLYNDADTLERTRPFIEFGLSSDGDSLVAATGYVPIPSAEKPALLELLNGETGSSSGLSGGAIVGIVIGVLVAIGLVAFLVMRNRNASGKEFDTSKHNNRAEQTEAADSDNVAI